MDDIELAVMEAWRRVGPWVLADPVELARRRARMRGPTLSRPPREWCLAVRACDRRLDGARVPQERIDD